MSQDITEACPRFCLLEMVCVHLKDLFKRAREREREEERVINGSLRVRHRDPIADVHPKQSGSALPALLMINRPGVTFKTKTIKTAETQLFPLSSGSDIEVTSARMFGKNVKNSAAFCDEKAQTGVGNKLFLQIKCKIITVK